MKTRYDKASLALTASNQTLYTVPSDAEKAIISFGVCNNIAADTTLTLWVVDSGGAAGDTNKYITAVTVASTAINPLDAITGMVLETGDFIVAVAADANRLNLRIGIMEILG